MRRYLALTLSLLFVGACGGGDEAAQSSTTSTSANTSSTTSSTTTSDGPSVPDCVAKERDSVVDLQASGTTTQAYVTGSGTTGVVLSHQSDGDLCQLHAYAGVLRKMGYRAIAVNNTGFVPEVEVAAADYLSKHGAKKIVLLGASAGGTVALVSADKVKVQAVAALSPPLSYFDLKPASTIGKITAPVFIGAGAGDGDFPADAKALAKLARSSSHVEQVTAPGGGHGVDFLEGTSNVAVALRKFLATYAPPR